jgi:uncharacterized protein YciI
MKNLKYFQSALFLCLLSLTISAFGQKKAESDKPDSNPYNAELAEKLGADDYGMKQYVFVILKTGSAKITDKKRIQELQAGHMANIGRLAKLGKLVLAGPFIDGGEKRGLYIFNVTTIEEAKELVKTDPAINAGYFDVEMTKYYGSAALMKINEIHGQVQKKPI